MGQFVDNRESEISDLLWDGIDAILGEIAPVLDAEQGAFDGATNYKNTVRGRLHKKLHDEIWPSISKQLDNVEKDINYSIEVEVDKAISKENERYIEMENEYDATIRRFHERVTELEEENQLFRENKAGMVHGKQYGI
jgi:hypothetical protein